jgi:hypothetical protein
MQIVMLSTIFVIKNTLWQKSSVMLVIIERLSHNVPRDDFMCNRHKCLYLLWRKLSVITYCRILWRQWPSHIGQSMRHIIHKSSQMICSGTGLDEFLWWRQGVMYSYADFMMCSFFMFCNLSRRIFKTFCVELEVSCIVWSFMVTC